MEIKKAISKAAQFITDPVYRFDTIAYRGGYNNMTDEQFLKKKFKLFFHKDLDLEHPLTFCEKLQWLKLYNRDRKYTQLVDKYEAKKYAAEKGVAVIPTIGVWNSPDEIMLSDLPEQFVLKCTHDSGGFVICKDRKSFDFIKAKKHLAARLNRNFYWFGREWPYKDVKPRIIAEPYIPILGNPESVEYKTTCFNGCVDFITVCRGVPHAELYKRKNDFYDREWNLLPFVTEYYDNSNMDNPKPPELQRLIDVCETLAKDIPYARVDCYIIDGEVVFGEITFFTWSGFIKFNPSEYDRILGDKIILPDRKKLST